jgi:hypothetical protein
MSQFSTFSVRTVAALAGAALTLGLAGPSLAQAPKDDLVRCQALYGQWLKYNGTSSYSKNVGPEMAIEECRRGDTTAGIADLKSILQRGRIPLPATETAIAK